MRPRRLFLVVPLDSLERTIICLLRLREADSDSDDSANWDVDFIDNFLRDQRRAKAAGASANASAAADAHSNDDEACHAEACYAIGSRALN